MPKRIQRKRTKGWRMPANCVSVTRPGKWGNPFRAGVLSAFGDVPDKETAVMFFRSLCRDDHLHDVSGKIVAYIPELRGKDLACYCGEGPCHADVLLELANKPR